MDAIYQEARRGAFAHRVATAVVVAAIVLALFAAAWWASDVLLLAFAGILLALLLEGIADWICSHTGLGHGAALAAGVFGMLAVAAVGGWLLAPSIAAQGAELADKLPQALESLRGKLAESSWGSSFLREMPKSVQQLPARGDFLGKLTGVFSITLGALANLVLVGFVGLFLAAQPNLYRRGFLRLIAPRLRPRAQEVMQGMDTMLRKWLVGQLLTMATVGTLTTVGLWALGVPLALALGLLAALFEFVPTLGPFLASIPAILLGLSQSPQQGLYVALLYIGIQSVESYLLYPLIQRKAVDLPPALTITAQILLGVLLGALGLVLATPLLVAAIVLVKKLYIEDWLGDGEPQSIEG
ncbi:MAG: AI-2E family transporter [Bryobacteraceae bacterium]|nr:AI-2E family transporter [Bryobacteraceae bacterium]